MNKRYFIFCLLIFLSAGLAGCITETDPDPGQTIKMALGDVQVFTATAVATEANTDYLEFYWIIKNVYFDDFGSQEYTFGESTSSYEFTADAGNVSNKMEIVCLQAVEVYHEWTFYNPIDHYSPVFVDQVKWRVEISQTPPVWQGSYHVENSEDLLFLQQNGYTEITNDLIIKNSILTNIDGLSCIKTVGDDIYIKSNPFLTNIEDLSSITSVSGLHILDNRSLTSLEGLHNITSPDHVRIHNNKSLTSLEGLRNIETIGVWFSVNNNPSLTVLGMSRLDSVGYMFSISQNKELCTYLAEELLAQVESGGGAGSQQYISENKDCSAL